MAESISFSNLIRERIKNFNAEEFIILNQRKSEADANNKNADLLFLILTFSLFGIFTIAAYVIKNQQNKIIFDQKIKEGESNFRLMAELMPEKVTNATPDGSVMYYNKSWQDFTGSSHNELVANGWAQWVHAEDLNETNQKWQHSITTGADFYTVLRMKNKDGQYRWHTCQARAIHDENGNIKLWVGL